MLKLNARLYKRIENSLYPKGQGELLIYSPLTKDSEYVSISFGDIALHVDKNAFICLCRTVVGENQ